MAQFFVMHKAVGEKGLGDSGQRIEAQIEKEGFSGTVKVYHLGLDPEDSISL
jgi:hypothetical protein